MTKPQDARNEGSSPSRAWSCSCLAHFARQTKEKETVVSLKFKVCSGGELPYERGGDARRKF